MKDSTLVLWLTVHGTRRIISTNRCCVLDFGQLVQIQIVGRYLTSQSKKYIFTNFLFKNLRLCGQSAGEQNQSSKKRKQINMKIFLVRFSSTFCKLESFYISEICIYSVLPKGFIFLDHLEIGLFFSKMVRSWSGLQLKSLDWEAQTTPTQQYTVFQRFRWKLVRKRSIFAFKSSLKLILWPNETEDLIDERKDFNLTWQGLWFEVVRIYVFLH